MTVESDGQVAVERRRATALEVDGVNVNFGGLRALWDVTLSITPGETRGIIGPNGAGKTTLFNVIEGRIRPESGDVRLFGDSLGRAPVHVRARRGLSRTFQITNLFTRLSVQDNVRLAAAGARAAARRNFWQRLRSLEDIELEVRELLTAWELWPYRMRRVDELAYGQQRVLEMVVGLASKPKVLLLDEPTAGLARSDAKHLTDTVRNLPEDLTVLLIEHDMDVAFSLSDRITVLANGHPVADGLPDDIEKDPVVIEHYLGTTDDAS